ncbi:LSM12 homolog a [Arctopsyche grandis]|uniref:LSM12 homolog a n=1 Tax=Arctopsyche grandis TaxID=121162 RepID=UPI00406DA30D
MAVVADCFTIGSVVACRTCYDQDIEGEVLAFDAHTKMLILKCPSSSGDARLNDVNIVNLALVSDVQIKREVSVTPDAPQSLDLHRLDTRVKKQIEDKRRLVSALSCVDPEGQQLFLAISKTITDVTWSGQNIQVFNHVHITPPYKVENIRGDPDSKQFVYIKKVVERHFKECAGGPSQSP